MYTRYRPPPFLTLSSSPHSRLNFLATSLQPITSHSPDRHIYSHILKSISQECELFQTRHLVDEMPQRKVQAQTIAKILHAQSLKFGFGLKANLGNAIVDLYAKCGYPHFAQFAFDRLDDRDVASWNSMLVLYVRSGFPKETIRDFGAMQNGGVKPNQFTFELVLSGCVRLGDVRPGRLVHCYVV